VSRSVSEPRLVSIGIPTYRRPQLLVRALGSAREQTHPRLEILIADNASGDETERICREAQAADERVRYLPSERNVGPTANFNRLFAACAGDYVQMLADDDWLDRDYVARCAEVLDARPEVALAAGRARYYRDGVPAGEGAWHRHLQDDPARRVIDYLSTVTDNGVFYGLVRGAAVRRAGPMPNVLGNDWLHVARIAAQGVIEMRDDVHVNRELDGTSVDVQSILDTFGQASWRSRIPQLVIAWEIARDLCAGGDAYAAIGAGARPWVAGRAALGSISWPDLAWHLVTPSVVALGRRPCGRMVWRAYERVTRSLGAGRSD
jgi:hypothetical protein